jgi:uncharacterized protein
MLDGLLAELMLGLPALLVVGPRATGKSTTARRHAATVVQLDQPAEATVFEADPDAALRDLPEPVLLDEWQAVPSVLGAVKRSVDTDSRPGRFLLTGSVRGDLDVNMWAATGRVVRVEMFPLTVAEQLGRGTRPLIDRVVDTVDLLPAEDAPDLRGYVDLALRGGFPDAALARPLVRDRWLDSYVNQMVTRDALDVDGARDPERLGRFFHAYAVASAGVVEHKALYEAAHIDRKTAIAYTQVLKNLMIVDELPAWATNRLKRLVRSPKRYLIDSALFANSLAVDAAAVMRNGDVLGRLIETFVVAQLRAEATVAESRPRLFHLRRADAGREVDVVAETRGGGIVGIEVKTTSAPKPDDARHLAWLRDEVGPDFVAGIVLHTGPRTFTMGDRIVAAPICTLWA